MKNDDQFIPQPDTPKDKHFFMPDEDVITISGTGVSNRGAIRSVSGNNTIAGQITIAAHTEIASDSGTLTLNISSGSSITASNKNVTFDGAGNITVADPIATGSGTLTKSGSGTLTLSESLAILL